METKQTDETTLVDELEPLHGEFTSQRRFLVVVSPLCVVYAVSALLYRHSRSLIAMWCNVAALLLLIVVLVWFMFRKPAKNGSRESGTSLRAPRWINWLLRLAGSDVWFFGMTVVLPLVLIVVSVLADQLHVGGTWLWWVDSVLGAVYLMYLLALIFAAGYRAIAVLLTANQRELQHVQREATILRRQNELASKTHDTVANGLSDIAMLAEQFCDEDGGADDSGINRVADNEINNGESAERSIKGFGKIRQGGSNSGELVLPFSGSRANASASDADDAEEKAWRLVHDVALHSLDNLHAVIDLLGVPENGKSETETAASSADEKVKEARAKVAESSEMTEMRENKTTKNGAHLGIAVSFADELGQIIDRSEASLQQQGFSGHTEAKNLTALPLRSSENAEQYDELLSLIGEIYANIAYHADKSQLWKMNITYRDGTIAIKQSNAIASSSDQSTRKRIPSGRGLHLHLQTIQELGGSMETQVDGTSWKLQVHLPIAQY
ncbi:hypothetical protein OZX67_06110 [Bifidobacterium sp. ESL0728]|uniref:hypothetical protein n=1 Tax=Bifidobacterium sp. ESL0728 TaxID=2983220 RepID=UPI0023F6815F|nr:hypothetical protein [Bifidobacterium sp. ESL0728]WEV58401.1 hypothetical protein OZX67_06110 [Bifidobacterium sp. ESL0728]